MTEKDYEKARIAVDAVIFTVQDKSLKVLLHAREKEPFKDKKELPGGLIRGNETAEDTLKRKLQEIIGQQDIFFQQFFSFTEPSRDPRERTISIGFIALVNSENIGHINEWYAFGSLPELAFDHKKIISRAKHYLKENVSSLIVKQFMPKQFPLNKLQEIYELIEEIKYDNRNFRKKMITSGIVEETPDIEKNVSHRPAKLYSFKI
ncbi:NUDIX hydrolase [Candidatus Woesearchaeota archaeon]|nr:NUDIX hydrolase [Candidatus Woesearchaeota archaeon]